MNSSGDTDRTLTGPDRPTVWKANQGAVSKLPSMRKHVSVAIATARHTYTCNMSLTPSHLLNSLQLVCVVTIRQCSGDIK
jgi:hypothetical protein